MSIETIYKYYKNSNTGELIKSQEFVNTIIDCPIYFYNHKGEKIGEDIDLVGYVVISEKKFNRLKKKMLRDGQ